MRARAAADKPRHNLGSRRPTLAVKTTTRRGWDARNRHRGQLMTLSFPYRFAVVICGEDGTNLGTVLAKRDWEPAHEWTRFFLSGRASLASTAMEARPCHSTLGAHTGRAILPGLPHPDRGSRVAAGCFGFSQSPTFAISRPRWPPGLSSRRSCARVRLYSYMVVAHPAPPEPPTAGGLSVTNASPGVPAQDASLNDFLARGQRRAA